MHALNGNTKLIFNLDNIPNIVITFHARNKQKNKEKCGIRKSINFKKL